MPVEKGSLRVTSAEHNSVHRKAREIAEASGDKIGRTDTGFAKYERGIARFNLNLPVPRRVQTLETHKEIIKIVEQPNPDFIPKSHNIYGEPLDPAPDPNPSEKVLRDLSSPKRILVPRDVPGLIVEEN